MNKILIALLSLMALSVLASAAPPAPAAPAAPAISAAAGDLQGVNIFPVEQLKPGMLGTGYTVIRGTQIQTFNATILELVPKGGFDGGPMILAKFSGPVVDMSKGIAAGYSGSPVYIGGKLLGAVSMAIPFTDTHIGGITPIRDMLPALPESEDADYSKNSVLPPVTDSGTAIDESGAPLDANGNPVKVEKPKDEAKPDAKDAAPGKDKDNKDDDKDKDSGAKPVQTSAPQGNAPLKGATGIVHMDNWGQALAYNERMRNLGIASYAGVRTVTPVLAAGISGNVLSAFKDKLAKSLGPNFELESSGMGGGKGNGVEPGLLLTNSKHPSAVAPGLFFGNAAKSPPLKPGAAVTVSLMQGDIEMNALGTLTYSDPSGRFLIFGHPMLSMGPTDMPLGEGYVTWTHTSIERPFKDGVRLRSVGKLTQDRGAACGGTFNENASMIPVRVKVKDIDLGTEKSLKFEVIKHPDFTPVLIAMGMAQASQQVIDRQLGGTMKMSFQVEGAGLKEPLRRENYYSDDSNVVFNGAFDIVPAISLLQTNIYRNVDITKVEIMVEITRNRVNASIDDAKIVWDKAKGKTAAGSSTAADGGAPAIADDSDDDTPAAPDADPEQPGDPSQPGTQPGRPPDPNQPGQPSPIAPPDAKGSQVQAPQQPPQPGQPNPGQPNPGQPNQPGAPGQSVPPGAAAVMGAIAAASADIPTFAPGDTIKVRVRLQPYRTKPVWREFSIHVPDDFPSGNTMIMVHGGGDLISPSETAGKGRSLFGMGPVIDAKKHDLDSILDQITQWPLNNELLLTLVRPYDPTQPQELGTTTPTTGAPPAPSDKPDDKVDAKYKMEWVVYNGFMLPVNILSKADQANAEKAKAAIEALKAKAKEAKDKDAAKDTKDQPSKDDSSKAKDEE